MRFLDVQKSLVADPLPGDAFVSAKAWDSKSHLMHRDESQAPQAADTAGTSVCSTREANEATEFEKVRICQKIPFGFRLDLDFHFGFIWIFIWIFHYEADPGPFCDEPRTGEHLEAYWWWQRAERSGPLWSAKCFFRNVAVQEKGKGRKAWSK